jgi:3-hydroxyisobutyrate dehydrogenase
MRLLHEGLVRTWFRGQFEPASFALALSLKDITLATELGQEYNVPMPVANLVQQIVVTAFNRGWGDQDSNAACLLQEEAAGVQVRAAHIDPARAGKFISTYPEVE